MKLKLFGLSSQGLPILSYVFGDSVEEKTEEKTGDPSEEASSGEGAKKPWPVILILGGVHGDEPEGNYIALGLLKKWMNHFPYKLRLTLVPCFNTEGSLIGQRTNGHQVDLNRNLPTKNWSPKVAKKRYHPGPKACSEPENQALVKWIANNPVKLILSLHSWNPMINTNGECQPEASIIAQATGYKITNDIGYPTPGSLGDYCGLERNIPVITYEAQKGSSIKEALTRHVPAIEKALFASEKR